MRRTNARASIDVMRGAFVAVLCVVVVGCGSTPEDTNLGNNLGLADADDDTSIDTGQANVDSATTDSASFDTAPLDAPADVVDTAADAPAIDTAPDVVVVDADPGACPAGSDGRACAGSGHCCGGSCVTSDSIATCGVSCTPCASPAHSIATCSAGACGSKCAAGYEDCDKSAGNGCESLLATDPNNCGTCGKVCPGAADPTLHQVATCTGGATCGIACAAGYAGCDGSDKNGCETNTDTDTFNCGTCKNKCTWPAVYCVKGTCSATP